MNAKTTRRAFLATAAAATAMATSASAAPAPARKRRKPNLLFLWTDEQRPDTIDVYGNRRIQSPNLSKLAAESVVFRNAYVSQPVCTPSRSTVMTGLWPHQTGLTQNNIALPETVRALPEIIDDADYRTGYFGKWHLGDEIFAQHGFEEWRSIEDGYWKYYREGRDASRKSSYCEWLKGLDHRPDTSRGDFSRDFCSRLPIEHCKPKYLEQEACDFLRRHRDEPFMLYVNFLEPHMPFSGPLNDLYKPEDVELPVNFNDPLEANEPESYRARAATYSKELYEKRFDLNTEAGWRQLIANYWGLVTQVDRSIGAILATLNDLGLAEDTIVVFTSDHGDMMGSHKLLTKGCMYQEAMCVPWIVRYPRKGRGQRIVDGHVSHIDLAPTLLDLMGAHTQVDLPGKSLVPVMKGDAPASDPVFVQWTAPAAMPEGPNPGGAQRDLAGALGPSVRTVIAPDGWKLSLSVGDRSQLFNLAADPGETTNLFDHPDSKPVIDRLSAELRNWQKRVGDELVLPEPA